jgi:NlpC/P60 family putative phage cell wall peptidase
MADRDPAPPAVAVARVWLGTPYVHGASAPGAGCDCLGLVRGVWRALYGTEPETPPPYSPDWAEAGGVETLWRAAARRLVEIDAAEAAPGDVLLFRMVDGCPAKHLGVRAADAAGLPTVIHAYARRGVVESPLVEAWARRVVAAFRFPETAD